MAQRWHSPSDRSGGVDPISVAFAALEQEANRASDNGGEGAGTPVRARLGHLVERARSVIGSGDGEAGGEAAPKGGAPMEARQAEQEEKTTGGSASGSHEAGPDDPGWVFHRRVGDGGREGWLYHYADGTMVSEDGTVYEYPSHDTDSLAKDPTVEEGTSDGGAGERTGDSPTEVSGAHEKAPSDPPADRETKQPEDDSEDKSEDETKDQVEEESRDEEDGSDEEASVPEVEGGGGPMASVTDAVAGVWLKDKAKGKQTLEPTDADDQRTGESTSGASGSETVHIPAFIEYSPTNLLRYLSGGLFVLAAIAAVMTIFYAVQAESMPHVILGGVFVVIALLSSWVLLSWEPTVVSIREGILEVAKGPHGEQVDLRDPRTEVEVGHNVGSPTWKTIVHRAGAKDIKIRAGQVKARQFAAIVEHYVSHPRQKPLDEED